MGLAVNLCSIIPRVVFNDPLATWVKPFRHQSDHFKGDRPCRQGGSLLKSAASARLPPLKCFPGDRVAVGPVASSCVMEMLGGLAAGSPQPG